MGFLKESRIAVRSADAGKELLLLEEETKKVDLSGFSEVYLPPEIKKAFAELPFKGVKQDHGGQVIAAGGAATISQGLYRATIDPSQLMKYSNGTVSSIGVKGGTITGHNGFQAAGAGVFAPILVYQLMAAVTGQYYLNGISVELRSLNSKVDELIQLKKFENQAKLVVFSRWLRDLASKTAIQQEDLNILAQKRYEVDELKTAAIAMVESRDPRSLEVSLTESIGNKMKTFDQVLATASPIQDAITVFVAEKALRLADLVEMRVNVQLGQKDVDRLRRVQELSLSIDRWSDFAYTQRKIQDKVKLFAEHATNTLDGLSKKVFINQDEITRKKNEVSRDSVVADQTLSKTLGDLRSLSEAAESIRTSLKEEVEYVLAIKKGEVSLFGKRTEAHR